MGPTPCADRVGLGKCLELYLLNVLIVDVVSSSRLLMSFAPSVFAFRRHPVGVCKITASWTCRDSPM